MTSLKELIDKLLGREQEEEIPWWELEGPDAPSQEDLIQQINRMRAANRSVGTSWRTLVKQFFAFMYGAIIVASAIFNPFSLETLLAYGLIMPLLYFLGDYIVKLHTLERIKRGDTL